MEDAGAAPDGGGDGGEVEDVNEEDDEAGGGVGGAGEREEVGGVGVGKDGGVYYGVALFQKDLHQPCSDEAVGSGHANGWFLVLVLLRRFRHFFPRIEG